MSRIKTYLYTLDKEGSYLEEYQIAGKLRSLSNSKPLKGDDLLEFFAFSYFPSDSGESEWGTYYGSEISGTDKNGALAEFPARESITEAAIKYYKKRANETKNASLKYRYSDLVIDFEKKLSKKVDIIYYQYAIDSVITLLKKSDLHGVVLKNMLERAACLAKWVNDKERMNNLKKASIAFEKKVAEDDKPGLWGFTLELFLLENDVLTEEESKKQISILEKRFLSLLKNQKMWAAQCAAILLLEYYSKDTVVNEPRMLEILQNLYDAYKEANKLDNHPLVVIHNLEEVRDLAYKYVSSKIIQEFGDIVQKELTDYKPDWEKVLKKSTVKMNIDNKRIKEFIDSILIDGPLGLVFVKVAYNFIPKKVDTETQLAKLKKDFPFQYFAERSVIGPEGQIVGNSSDGKIENFDFIQLYAQNLCFQDFFLAKIMVGFFDKYKEEDVLVELKKSLLIEKQDEQYIKAFLDDIYTKKYIEASALITPFIEKMIRRLCRINGEIVSEIDTKYGGYKYSSLNKLLEMDGLKRAFPPREEDVSEYLKNTLTAKIGLNLRNDFCHGDNLDRLNVYTAFRLFHILILLSLVRKLKEDKEL